MMTDTHWLTKYTHKRIHNTTLTTSMKKLYTILWICPFICLASVSSARKCGSKRKNACQGFNATFTTLGATGRLGPKTLGSHYVNKSQDGMVRLDKGIQMFTVPCTGKYRISVAACQGFNATFTTLGTTGRLGPKTLGSHYANKSQDGMVLLDMGIQIFTVPCTGKYRISVAGAAGPSSKRSPIEFRGRGAWLSGVFHLTKGNILKILVGQVGGYNERYSTGGGGGTFITDINNKPIIIAGGGGTQESNSLHWQCDDTTNTTGNPNYGGTLYQGGRDGQGATDGPSGASGRWTGGGGGGILSDGKDGSVSIGRYTQPGGGKEGGTGGNNPRATGGFGGGGGSFANTSGGGGGGGGYSGGAKGDNIGHSCAGGGGSYNTGSHQQGKSGDNNGEGYALITWIE